MLFSELCEKEVVNIKTGARLGLIDDIEFDENTFEIRRFHIYGKGELFGLFGKGADTSVERKDVEILGNDIVLVRDETKLAKAGNRR